MLRAMCPHVRHIEFPLWAEYLELSRMVPREEIDLPSKDLSVLSILQSLKKPLAWDSSR